MRCEIVASAVPSSFLLVSLLLLLLLHQRVASSEAGMLLPSPERAVKKTPQQDKCTLPTPTPTPLLRDVSRCCADCGVRAYVHTDSGQAGRQAGKQMCVRRLAALAWNAFIWTGTSPLLLHADSSM
ncbi:hypothetical protein IWX48DRAFT_614136 [Phyllosticta citricarpa]